MMKTQGEGLEGTIDALLAEGATALFDSVPGALIEPYGETSLSTQRRAREEELERHRTAAEACCEDVVLRRRVSSNEISREGASATTSSTSEWSGSVGQVDTKLRHIAREFARRDLIFGEIAEDFWKADGWRRLGYATATQYAREQLGMSLSSVKAKRALTRRTRTLPRLRHALDEGELGYEAARLVGIVASNRTEAAWIVRARERTVKHLREEVEVVQMLRRLELTSDMAPPATRLMETVAAIERRVLNGETFLDGQGQTSAPATRRVTLKVRVARPTYRYFKWLESAFRKHGPRTMSFLRYLCVASIYEWQQKPRGRVAYDHIYERDRGRCTSPVCTRRDLTPHHLVRRSAGGDDSDENLASLCVWCHLAGVHGGSLKVDAPASSMTWYIGRPVHTRVCGRERRYV
jgi:hypothetical protein